MGSGVSVGCKVFDFGTITTKVITTAIAIMIMTTTIVTITKGFRHPRIWDLRLGFRSSGVRHAKYYLK